MGDLGGVAARLPTEDVHQPSVSLEGLLREIPRRTRTVGARDPSTCRRPAYGTSPARNSRCGATSHGPVAGGRPHCGVGKLALVHQEEDGSNPAPFPSSQHGRASGGGCARTASRAAMGNRPNRPKGIKLESANSLDTTRTYRAARGDAGALAASGLPAGRVNYCPMPAVGVLAVIATSGCGA